MDSTTVFAVRDEIERRRYQQVLSEKNVGAAVLGITFANGTIAGISSQLLGRYVSPTNPARFIDGTATLQDCRKMWTETLRAALAEMERG